VRIGFSGYRLGQCGQHHGSGGAPSALGRRSERLPPAPTARMQPVPSRNLRSRTSGGSGIAQDVRVGVSGCRLKLCAQHQGSGGAPSAKGRARHSWLTGRAPATRLIEVLGIQCQLWCVETVVGRALNADRPASLSLTVHTRGHSLRCCERGIRGSSRPAQVAGAVARMGDAKRRLRLLASVGLLCARALRGAQVSVFDRSARTGLFIASPSRLPRPVQRRTGRCLHGRSAQCPA
jgi:hypothetical protein